MKIVIIDNYDSFTYNLYQQICGLSDSGDEVLVFRNDEIDTDAILKLEPQGLVISPGPGGPEDTGVSKSLTTHLAGHIPILGVCLGHQLLAWQAGAEICRSPRPTHGKCSNIFHNQEGLFAGLPSPFPAARYHSLIVGDNLPASYAVDARCEEGLIMAIRHKELPLYGVQFHPESFLTQFGNALMKNFLSLCRKADNLMWKQNIPDNFAIGHSNVISK